jgi:hypothetical protein
MNYISRYTRRQAFVYGITESLGDTIIPVILETSRYAVLGWDWYYSTFFSAQAQKRYTWVGSFLGCMVALAYLYTQRWVDNQVESALSPQGVWVETQTQTQEVSTGTQTQTQEVVLAETPIQKLPTVKELREMCQDRGVKWRNANGPNLHLRKSEMIEALSNIS